MNRRKRRKTKFAKSSLSACNARPVHTEGPGGDIHLATERRPNLLEVQRREEHHIGLDLSCIAANELGLEPPADREIRTGRHKLLDRSLASSDWPIC